MKLNLSDEESRVLCEAITSDVFRNLIGAEEWDLSEPDEMILWDIINRVKDQ
jgi:hypothetical protein